MFALRRGATLHNNTHCSWAIGAHENYNLYEGILNYIMHCFTVKINETEPLLVPGNE